jgi:hypothetical protein
MNRLYQSDHMVDRCIGKNAMAKVEDVARSALCFTENPIDFFLDQINWTKENDGIEVSLDGYIISKTGPGLL